MELYVLVVFSALLASTVAPPPSTTEQYRTDYEYNKKTKAFYKLHIETTYQSRCKAICETEGATLIVPTSNEEITQIHGMMKRFPDIGNYVYVGDDGDTHESAEETPIIDMSHLPDSQEHDTSAWRSCDVVTRQGEIETMTCFRQLPFVCKVEAINAVYDGQCGVYGRGYTYYSSSRSCYKVSTVALAWNEAFAECRAEGAHLVVLNSEAEHEAVKTLISAAPKVSEAKTSYFFLAGIRANRPTDSTDRVFKTIFNETLEEAGYSQWSDGEPNNYQDSEYCGSIFSNTGKYNDVDCSHTYAFVCEKETQKQN